MTFKTMVYGVMEPEASQRVTRAFTAMEIAAERLSWHEENHPDRVDDLRPVFPLLRPSKCFNCCRREVYAHHCDELILRVLEGDDLRLGTVAECLMFMSAISLKFPPNKELRLLYQSYFQIVFSDSELPNGRPWEKFDGNYEHTAVCDLDKYLRKKLSDKERRIA